METKRAIVAILLSMIILLGYQYFLAPLITPAPPEAPEASQTVADSATNGNTTATATPMAAVPVATLAEADQAAVTIPTGRAITVDTSLYRAVFTEAGGGLQSFKLKKYRQELAADSPPVELVTTKAPPRLPLFFSWGVTPDQAQVPLLSADHESLTTNAQGEATLTMQGSLPTGLTVTRTLVFNDHDYRIHLDVAVRNNTDRPLQGAPYLSMVNRQPTTPHSSRVFTGAAALINGSLQEVNSKDLAEAPQTLNGTISWAAFETTYFMSGVIPATPAGSTLQVSGDQEETEVTTVLSEAAAIIPPQGERRYSYTLFFGPKQLETLKTADHDLAKIVNFGWFDVMAKPTLYLLNFLDRYVHNYGIAIILVTIIIKLLFWPISHKGMKSMKTMQKIQPKMAKLREKFKDDQQRLNQEMMKLYQTYKINPLGGCLPMVLQIPVFFALYKVLLQTIELRHAPFMLWITDLSAPDRLFIGFQIPYLGGIPVLTLLMGGSMFLQQKMTPTSADPTQAKMMLFLPVIFTFMFINFASGLVLYWFLNNLLSMLQQYIINRQTEAEA